MFDIFALLRLFITNQHTEPVQLEKLPRHIQLIILKKVGAPSTLVQLLFQMDPLTISRLHRCSNTALSIAELGTGLIPIRGELKINFWRSEAVMFFLLHHLSPIQFRIAYFFQGGRAVTILIKPLQFLRMLESLFANRRLHLFRWECIHVRTSVSTR